MGNFRKEVKHLRLSLKYEGFNHKIISINRCMIFLDAKFRNTEYRELWGSVYSNMSIAVTPNNPNDTIYDCLAQLYNGEFLENNRIRWFRPLIFANNEDRTDSDNEVEAKSAKLVNLVMNYSRIIFEYIIFDCIFNDKNYCKYMQWYKDLYSIEKINGDCIKFTEKAILINRNTQSLLCKNTAYDVITPMSSASDFDGDIATANSPILNLIMNRNYRGFQNTIDDRFLTL
jgi:hypothetical protein